MINTLYEQLDEYWMTIVKELKVSLKDVGRYASGNTAQAIGEYNTKPVVIVNNQIKITIVMPSHYIYIDRGVNGALSQSGALPLDNGKLMSYKNGGKIPNIGAIRKFMLNRGIDKPRGSNTKAGKTRDAEAVLNSIAFAIAKSIWAKGLKPTSFYSNVVNDKKLLDFESRLVDMYKKYIVSIVAL
tara:strand:+ start:736 stop:1290 length:555 start_codon:yes stop_codon:yes gene_type:complete